MPDGTVTSFEGWHGGVISVMSDSLAFLSGS
jgi:hypothetical protein